MEKTKKRTKRSFRPSVALTILFVILALYAIIFFMPLLWTVITSLKDWKVYRVATVKEDLGGMLGFSGFTFSNYGSAFKYLSMPTTKGDVSLLMQFVNSFLYAGGCAIVATMVPCVMAYLVARYRYRFGKIVYGIVLVTMAIPIVGSLPSEMKMVSALGLMDSVFGLYLLRANFLGIYFLVFYATFKMIPKDYTEAAELDGASEFYIMLRIIFPLAIGTITTVALLKFIEFWNDYQIPMIYWESRPVVAYGMYYFVHRSDGGSLSQTPVKLAGMIIVAIPILILFGIFNKKIMSNMSIGGVKE